MNTGTTREDPSCGWPEVSEQLSRAGGPFVAGHRAPPVGPMPSGWISCLPHWASGWKLIGPNALVSVALISGETSVTWRQTSTKAHPSERTGDVGRRRVGPSCRSSSSSGTWPIARQAPPGSDPSACQKRWSTALVNRAGKDALSLAATVESSLWFETASVILPSAADTRSLTTV